MNLKLSLVLISLLTLASCAQDTSKGEAVTTQDAQAIIGGTKVGSQDAVGASTVAIGARINGAFQAHCTGTLIATDLVMTAAHCLDYFETEEILIFLGQNLPKTFYPKYFHTVADVVTHPDRDVELDENYEYVTAINDIAVFRLNKKAPDQFVPVPILDSSAQLMSGETLLLAGFGLLNEIGDPKRADGLYAAHVPLEKYWKSHIITNQTHSKGACVGDSGGPAYVETAEGLIVVGVTLGSHNGAADCRHYGEYTDASKYKHFILESALKMDADLPRFVSFNSTKQKR